MPDILPRYENIEGLPGCLATGTPNIIRGTIEEIVNGHESIYIPAGSALVFDPAEPRKKYLPAQTDTPVGATEFGGVTILNNLYGASLYTDKEGVPPSNPIDTLGLGDVWLYAETAVQKGQPVLYRNVDAGEEKAGRSFTGTAGVGFVEISGAFWLTTTSAAGLAIASFKTLIV